MNNNSPVYDVDYFIDKLSKVPYKDWGVGSIAHKCAYWHLTGTCDYSGESCHEFTELFATNFPATGCVDRVHVATSINDGLNPNYQQKHPKDRILAALHDIKSIQEQQSSQGTIVGQKSEEQVGKVEYPDLTKSLATLPIDETSDVKVKSLISDKV